MLRILAPRRNYPITLGHFASAILYQLGHYLLRIRLPTWCQGINRIQPRSACLKALRGRGWHCRRPGVTGAIRSSDLRVPPDRWSGGKLSRPSLNPRCSHTLACLHRDSSGCALGELGNGFMSCL